MVYGCTRDELQKTTDITIYYFHYGGNSTYLSDGGDNGGEYLAAQVKLLKWPRKWLSSAAYGQRVSFRE